MGKYSRINTMIVFCCKNKLPNVTVSPVSDQTFIVAAFSRVVCSIVSEGEFVDAMMK
jgi:hypothetical protein